VKAILSLIRSRWLTETSPFIFATYSVRLNLEFPPNPTNTDVLSIPGLIPLLDAKRAISDSFSQSETTNLFNAKRDRIDSYSISGTDSAIATAIANNPGPKGDKGEVGQKGAVGLTGSGGSKGQKGEIGSTGVTGQKGEIGASGTNGNDEIKGQKGESGTGSSLTTAEQTCLDNAQTNLTQTATGITALNFDNFGAIKAKNSSGHAGSRQ